MLHQYVDEDQADLVEMTLAAEKHDATAQMAIAELYRQGHVLQQRDERAIHWFLKAAHRGHIRAKMVLAEMYHLRQGCGTGHDEAAASDKNCDVQSALWYREAAYDGDPFAQSALAYIYYSGRGVEQCDETAVYWYRQAAMQEHTAAQYNLGLMYELGRGVQRDYDQAIRLYTTAVNKGHIQAQYNLALIYDEGRGIEEPDEYKAVQLYMQAAHQGHAPAQVNLGVMYDEGRGVPQSDIQAAFWYRKAALQGNMIGQNNLGWLYDLGQGVEQDDKQAMRWYSESASQGYSAPQFCLGAMYELGIGVKRDEKMAMVWYSKAAEGEEPDALIYLQEMKNVDGHHATVPQNHCDDDLMTRYRKAAKQGNLTAQYFMGLIYEKGLGVPKDVRQASEWYNRASEHGHENAKQRSEYLSRPKDVNS